jgi:hypothetical protein
METVVPNTQPAETAVETMNKNPAAHLFYTLKEQGVEEGFLNDILQRGFDVALYTWISLVVPWT